MKKNLLNPSFEFMFALGIITMLMLPPMVMAQQPPKQLKVIIENNDTTINGKNIKQLSASERATALKDMADVSKDIRITSTGKGIDHITYMRSQNGDDSKDVVIEREGPGNKEMAGTFRFRADTSDNHWKIDQDELRARADKFAKSFRFDYDSEKGSPRLMRMGGPGNRNSQSFSYSNTNKDGFSTHVNYNVSDVNRETAKKIAGIEKPELAIEDLMLNPSFSTGKTNLSFTLPQKGSAEVQFKDSDGKVLWTDKTTGNFYKSFELPQNGIYFLQVKQGSKIGLRRIVKEQ